MNRNEQLKAMYLKMIDLQKDLINYFENNFMSRETAKLVVMGRTAALHSLFYYEACGQAYEDLVTQFEEELEV